MSLPKVHSFQVHKMLTDSRFLKEIKKSVSIVRTYDIPYVAGYSVDGKKVFIDRHMDTNFKGTDITKYLVLHEKTEKALLIIFNLKYQQAHHIATYVEHDAVVKDGLDWKEYEKFVEKYVKKLDHENLQKSPPDLDLEPYEDEKDFHKFVKKRSNEKNRIS
jgi:hypothetical protein